MIPEVFKKTPKELWHARGTIKADVGIEIETEHKGRVNIIETNFWTSKADGSLRNGIEYVLAKPINISKLDEAMADFTQATQGFQFIPSPRTSVHVHVNVSYVPIGQIVSAWTAYFMYENLFLAAIPERKGNVFCLRSSDADVSVRRMCDLIRNKCVWPAGFDREYRYSALNVQPMVNFGSLEFRFLPGTTDAKYIGMWTKALHRLVRTSSKMSVNEVFEHASGSSVVQENFLTELVGEEASNHIRYKAGPDWSNYVDEGVEHGLSFLTAWNEVCREPTVKFIKPAIFSYHEDLPVGDQKAEVIKNIAPPVGINYANLVDEPWLGAGRIPPAGARQLRHDQAIEEWLRVREQQIQAGGFARALAGVPEERNEGE